jgi:hypothetical protein
MALTLLRCLAMKPLLYRCLVVLSIVATASVTTLANTFIVTRTNA